MILRLLCLVALPAVVLARADITLAGQSGRLEWHVPDPGDVSPLAEPPEAAPPSRDFIVGRGPEVTALGSYPSVSLEASGDALAFSFSEGWCCRSVAGDRFVGPVVTFTSLPADEDLGVTIGDTNLAVTASDLLVSGNRIAVDLRGRDISGGRLTLLVAAGSNVTQRVTLALIGLALIALGMVRRRWLG